MQKRNLLFYALLLVGGMTAAPRANACTGITLKTTDGDTVVARTIDWSGSEMNNMYVIMPRAQTQRSLLPDGTAGGAQFVSKYGFVGLAVELPQFVVDGTNEAGLSAALFYFPGYGEYAPYDADMNDRNVSDFQLVSWILSNFSTIDEVKNGIKNIRVINIDPRSATTHWRITEQNGKQVILEIVDGVPRFYDSKIGVLANSPGYPWHITNLNNYINLVPGTIPPTKLGALLLQSISHGTGLHGLPGDMSSPSRFARAAFFSSYARNEKTSYDTVMQAFHLLNNFDVPIGIQFAVDTVPTNMPSATQWTIATDLANKIIYYHTMYDRTIRRIDMNKINFAQVAYQSHPLDPVKHQTIFDVEISTQGNIPTTDSLDEIAAKVFAKPSAKSNI